MPVCIFCGKTYTDGREMTCSQACHDELADCLVARFGEFKKVVRMSTGVAYKVPTRDIIEKGIREQDLDQLSDLGELIMIAHGTVILVLGDTDSTAAGGQERYSDSTTCRLTFCEPPPLAMLVPATRGGPRYWLPEPERWKRQKHIREHWRRPPPRARYSLP